MTRYLKKQRKLLDADTTIWEVIQHSFVNFLFGVTSSIVIIALTMNQWWLVVASYYLHKQLESRILNRNRYTTRLGKYYIFPIPSTIGFFLGWYLSKII